MISEIAASWGCSEKSVPVQAAFGELHAHAAKEP